MSYRIINKDISNTIIIDKSKFITKMYYLDNEEKQKEILEQVKLEYPKATHYCYAYILLKDNILIENQSDDHEPSRTAGMPMLEVLRHESLVNVLVIVVRYFGGIKLGTGGLIRAYSNSVKEIIRIASIKNSNLYYGYQIELDYSYNEKLCYNIKNIKGIILKQEYLDNIILECYLINEDDIKIISNMFNNELVISKIANKYL